MSWSEISRLDIHLQHRIGSGAYANNQSKLHVNHACYITVMKHMPKGSLTSLLKHEYYQLTYRRKVISAHNIAIGMNRIHRHGRIHRDIRPDNILIDNYYEASIEDMGISKAYSQFHDYTAKPIGCVSYMSPEFYQNISNDKVDIYTFGLTLNHLFTGVTHYFDHKSKTIRLPYLSSMFPNLIKACLCSHYIYRPTAATILCLLQTFRNYLENRIRFNPHYNHYSNEERDVLIFSLFSNSSNEIF